jgi:hypothetical protein
MVMKEFIIPDRLLKIFCWIAIAFSLWIIIHEMIYDFVPGYGLKNYIQDAIFCFLFYGGLMMTLQLTAFYLFIAIKKIFLFLQK